MVIVVDGAVDVPPDIEASPWVRTVPGGVWLGDQPFTGSVEEFWALLRSGRVPSTSPPTVAALAEAYAQGDPAIAVHVSSELSTTVARAGEAAGRVGTDVAIVDTRSLSVGAGLVVEGLHRAIQRQSPDTAIVALGAALAHRLHTYVLVQEPAWLRHSGRAGLLPQDHGWRERPLVLGVRGRAIVLEQVKSRHEGIRRLAAHVQSSAGSPVTAWALGHADAPDVEDVVEKLGQALRSPPSFTVSVDPAVGTHVGPAAVVMGAMSGT